MIVIVLVKMFKTVKVALHFGYKANKIEYGFTGYKSNLCICVEVENLLLTKMME